MLFKQFILKTGLLVLITSTICFVVFQLAFPQKYLMLYPLLPVFFGIINITIYYSLSLVKDSSLSKFSTRYLLCTTIKLLSSLAFVVVFLLIRKEEVIPFLATFLSVYFIFLFQEIVSILNFFKKNEKRETAHAKT